MASFGNILNMHASKYAVRIVYCILFSDQHKISYAWIIASHSENNLNKTFVTFKFYKYKAFIKCKLYKFLIQLHALINIYIAIKSIIVVR